MTDYGASDTSTTSLGTNQFPIGEVYVPSGTQTSAAGGALTALEGGPASTDSASPAKRSAPASMWIKDGNNITFGAEADAAVTDSTQTTKTHMAFLKGLIKIFADVWDSTNHWLQVKVMNGNANGQATMVNSAPVVLASDQSNVPTNLAQVGGVATQMMVADGVAYTNVLEMGVGLDNGATLTRWNSAYIGGNVVDAHIGNRIAAMGLWHFNGTNFDRYRGNLDNIALLASAARTTTQTVADQTNYNGRGVIVTLDVTVAGTGSVTLEIDMKDPVSGKYKALLTGAAVTTISANIYTVYPAAPATANVSANSPLPRTWRVVVTHNNANTITYSCGASVIL